MSKDNSLLASLKTYVSHETTVHAKDSVAEASKVIQEAKVEFAAVLAEDRVIGLISSASLLACKDSAESIENLASADALLVSVDMPIPEIVNLAIQSLEEFYHPYMIAIDNQGEFVGLVPIHALLKLQRRNAQYEVDLLSKTIFKKNISLKQQESDINLLNSQLAEQKEMLRRLRTSRADFIKQYSHEAHTPMNGVLGMLELLSNSNLSEDQSELVNSAQSSARSMLRLIKSVLDYTQIETGNFVSVSKSFDPKELLNSLVDSVRFEAKQKDLELFCNIDLPDLQLIGDPERMGRAIENLIIQLLDRTTAGGVVLSAHARRSSSEWQLEINLRSQGSGLDLPKLDYALIGTMASDESQDMGSLSTAITQRVISKLHGVMKKVGDPGDDFGYQISVPFSSVDRVDGSPFSASGGVGKEIKRVMTHKTLPNASDSEHLTQILVVDDNRINLEVAQRLLAGFDCATYLAKDGVEALEMLKCIDVDCIFLDCEMPRMSGHEVCQKIREGACGADKADVLICAMTAHVLDSSRERCFEVGMDEFIPKPVSKKAFKAVLDKWEKRTDAQSHSEQTLLFKG